MPFVLPPKFNQHSLNENPALNPDLAKRLDLITPDLPPNTPSSPLWSYAFGRPTGRFVKIAADKDHVLTHPYLPGWVLKRDRQDVVDIEAARKYARDSNLYRIRKAAKANRILKENKEDHLIRVPKKYVYVTKLGEPIVVAEKIELAKETQLYSKNEALAIARLVRKAGLVDGTKKISAEVQRIKP